MQTMMTVKGQVTIPKRIRDRLGLKPGAPVEFEANTSGDVVIRKPGSRAKNRASRDRFDAAVGAATIKWKNTARVMSLLRPED
jgi:AbrB family looped-hinge helix DNA binding protein